MSCATVIQDSQDKIRSTKRQYGGRSLIPSMNNNHETIFETRTKTRTKTRAAYDQDRPDYTARLVWRSPALAHASRELLYPHVAHLSLKPCSKLKPYLVRRACLPISPLVNTTLICLWNCSRCWRGTCQFNWPLSQNRICTTVAQTQTESLRGTWICGWPGSRVLPSVQGAILTECRPRPRQRVRLRIKGSIGHPARLWMTQKRKKRVSAPRDIAFIVVVARWTPIIGGREGNPDCERC